MKYESVKINTTIVDKVRKIKEKTKMPIGSFFEIAAIEKIKNDKSKKMNSILCFIFGHKWFIDVKGKATCTRCNKITIKEWNDILKRQ